MIVGAQLYTVKAYCKTLEGLSETLKKVADIGYTTVQVSGTCPYEPAWMAEQLKMNGLTCGITHTSFQRMKEETEAVIQDHNILGCDYIGIGSGAAKDVENFAIEAKPVVQKFKEAGKLFMYHNHYQEYENKLEDGRNVMEYLTDVFSADEMGYTLDLYWVKYAGYDPMEEIQRLKGRLPCVHLKDMLKENDEMKMAWIGGGNTMDYEKLVAALADAGTKYAYVEQDSCYGEDPLECLRKSYNYLCAIGLR